MPWRQRTGLFLLLTWKMGPIFIINLVSVYLFYDYKCPYFVLRMDHYLFLKTTGLILPTSLLSLPAREMLCCQDGDMGYLSSTPYSQKAENTSWGLLWQSVFTIGNWALLPFNYIWYHIFNEICVLQKSTKCLQINCKLLLFPFLPKIASDFIFKITALCASPVSLDSWASVVYEESVRPISCS